MASRSQQMRHQYPEMIVGGVDSNWVVEGRRPKCDYSTCKRFVLLAGGPYSAGFIRLKFHPAAIDWARAMAAILLFHNYSFDESAGGSISCRKITGSSRTSLHAHAIAFDINPSRNRYTRTIGGGLIQWGRQTDMSKAMIADMEAVRTKNGKRVTQWGGRWWNIKDAMHFEPTRCERSDLETGIDFSTVKGWREYVAWTMDPGTIDPGIPTIANRELQMQLPLRIGDGYETPPEFSSFTEDRSFKSEDVESLQQRLGFEEALQDGFFGPMTAEMAASRLANGSDGKFIGGREWNAITRQWLAGIATSPAPHDHDGDYASPDHSHEGYAPLEHPHTAETTVR